MSIILVLRFLEHYFIFIFHIGDGLSNSAIFLRDFLYHPPELSALLFTPGNVCKKGGNPETFENYLAEKVADSLPHPCASSKAPLFLLVLF